MKATHQVVDFGPGPVDHTLGYPFEGSESECSIYIEQNQTSRKDSSQLCLQDIPRGEDEAGLDQFYINRK